MNQLHPPILHTVQSYLSENGCLHSEKRGYIYEHLPKVYEQLELTTSDIPDGENRSLLVAIWIHHRLGNTPWSILQTTVEVLDVALWISSHIDEPVDQLPALPRYARKGLMDALEQIVHDNPVAAERDAVCFRTWFRSLRRRLGANKYRATHPHATRFFDIVIQETEEAPWKDSSF